MQHTQVAKRGLQVVSFACRAVGWDVTDSRGTICSLGPTVGPGVEEISKLGKFPTYVLLIPVGNKHAHLRILVY